MRTWVIVVALAAAGGAFAQCHKIGEVNAEKPEGALLQQIGQEQDATKKLALMEQFAGQFPQHEAVGWVYEQMEAAYAKAGNQDKVLEVGAKLVAMPGDCVEASQQALKAAEAKKDPDLVKKWSNQTAELAKKVAGTPQPKEADEVDEWKRRVDFAKQVDKYTEYSLMATALAATDPAKKVDLIDTLEQRNPQSEYLPQLREQQFIAYRQTNNTAKAVSLAERLAEKNQADEDMLLVLADHYFNQKQPAKVIDYTARLVEVANAKPKPANVADADWDKRKRQLIGSAHWYAGMTYMSQSKYAEGEKALAEALPNVRETQALLAPTLFNLGLANYKLGGGRSVNSERILAALKYFDECSKIAGPLRAQALQNIKAIRSQYAVK